MQDVSVLHFFYLVKELCSYRFDLLLMIVNNTVI
jgi:hypothetical protein